jgi:catechol 2,3-dioxygenase-like lactoylglutathione lyase family enzyme
MTVTSISAITLAVANMARSLDFYQTRVGLELLYGGETASFSSFRVGGGFLNLILAPEVRINWWGRVILYVDQVDTLYRRLVESGWTVAQAPEDAPWGERYFHIQDPDGHEISFASRLKS